MPESSPYPALTPEFRLSPGEAWPGLGFPFSEPGPADADPLPAGSIPRKFSLVLQRAWR